MPTVVRHCNQDIQNWDTVDSRLPRSTTVTHKPRDSVLPHYNWYTHQKIFYTNISITTAKKLCTSKNLARIAQDNRSMRHSTISYKSNSFSLCFRFGFCWPLCVPSVLWRCWLGGRKGIRPVKNWVVGCWHGFCLEHSTDLHMAQMPLPLTISCFSKIQIGYAFLVPAHPGSPGQRAVKRVCVCVCVTTVHVYKLYSLISLKVGGVAQW